MYAPFDTSQCAISQNTIARVINNPLSNSAHALLVRKYPIFLITQRKYFIHAEVSNAYLI